MGVSKQVICLYDETSNQWTIFGEDAMGDFSLLHYHNGAVIPHDVKMIGQSKDGRIWFSNHIVSLVDMKQNPVLTSFDGKHWEPYAGKVNANNPNDYVGIGLFSGKDGDIWFWDIDELTRYDGQHWTHWKLTETLKDLETVIPESKNRPTQAYSRINFDIINGIQDRDGYVWLETVGGIVRYDKRRDEWKRFPQIKNISADVIYEDQQNRLWISEGHDAVVYDSRTNATVEYILSGHLPRNDRAYLLETIEQDKQGRLLFVYDEGILAYSEIGDKWDFCDIGSSGLGIRINHLIKDQAGRIWLSTESSLAMLDP